MGLNIKKIAKKAGVSVATISRALDPSKSHLVSLETVKKIKGIVQKYNYIPNKAAQALTRKLSGTIGMVTAFSTDIVKSPYYEGLISGVIEGMRPLHYDIKWIMIRDEEAERCGMADLTHRHFVDGIIFLTWRLYPNLVHEVEAKPHVPAVLINDYLPSVKTSIIHADNDAGVKMLLEYLAQKKYKSVGMLRGPEGVSIDAKQRHAAFRKYTDAIGIPVKKKHVWECQRFGFDTAFETMNRWIETQDLPRAVFAANDDLASGAIEALLQHKLRVPEDVAVVGYDGSPVKRGGHPTLTTVKQPLEMIGRASVETLDKLIQKKAKPPIQLKFSPELIKGESA